MSVQESGDSFPASVPLNPKEQRRYQVDPSSLTGSWHIVRQVLKPKEERKYWRRDGDVPFWWFVMDKWGINSVLYAIMTAVAFYIVQHWGGGGK